MTAQSRLKWTQGLVALSIPLVLGIGVVLLLVIGATRSMM
jgi:hypothetical protein